MRLICSQNFLDILRKMDNKIAHSLLNIGTLESNYNYIDITDQKDLVSFTPKSKVDEVLGNQPVIFKFNGANRNLSHSDVNDAIFNVIGYDKTRGDVWSIGDGYHERATILAETVSKTSGKTYVLIQEVNGSKMGVININGLTRDIDDSIVWKTSRNNLKVGRLARTILTDAKIEFTPKEIEDFTNQFKATYDFTKDALKQFDIVSGRDISFWYHRNNYEEGRGVLNNSCMCNVPNEFLDIYTNNSQVKMVILYGDSGIVRDGAYKCDKIKGRAILWDAELSNGEKIKFMDRVYTKNDSDVDLFKKLAQENGWWYKESQSMYPDINLTDGKSVLDIDVKVNVKLDRIDFISYPYIDTMCYGKVDDKTLTNDSNSKYHRMFRRTSGGYEDGNIDE